MKVFRTSLKGERIQWTMKKKIIQIGCFRRRASTFLFDWLLDVETLQLELSIERTFYRLKFEQITVIHIMTKLNRIRLAQFEHVSSKF